MLLSTLGVDYELGGLIYAICELRIIQLSISNNNHIINSETKRINKEFDELYQSTKNRCKELNIDWVIIENALNTIEQNYII
jgi:hypothetical protein